jgi:hypothetical protein
MRHSEAIFHRQVAIYLRVAIREPWFWTTFPAGGGGKARGAQLKRSGLMPGMPDILVVGPSRLIGLELKTAVGRQSPDQKAVAARFERCGWPYLLARNLDEVEVLLGAAGVPLQARSRGGFINVLD